MSRSYRKPKPKSSKAQGPRPRKPQLKKRYVEREFKSLEDYPLHYEDIEQKSGSVFGT